MSTTMGGLDLDVRVRAYERKSSQGPQGLPLDFRHVFELITQYEQGSGASKVDAVWARPPSALSATDLDLRGAAMLSLDGTAVTFPIVMGIFLKNLSTTTGEYVTIGGSSTPFITWLNATGDGVRVGPSGWFGLWSPIDGYATTAASADILTLTPATGTPSVAMLIVGRSA